MNDVPDSVGGEGGASPAGYVPVPVAVAKSIAESYSKSIVIIFAHDPVYGLVHTTTYGIDARNKAWAAQGGEIATKALGGLVDLASHFEDYRLEQAEKLLAALKLTLENLEGIGDGVDLPSLVICDKARAAVTEAERFLSSQGAAESSK